MSLFAISYRSIHPTLSSSSSASLLIRSFARKHESPRKLRVIDPDIMVDTPSIINYDLSAVDSKNIELYKDIFRTYGFGNIDSEKYKNSKVLPMSLFRNINNNVRSFSDPTIPPKIYKIGQYPIKDVLDTYGKVPIYKTLDVIYRNKFDKETLFNMKNNNMIPITLLGSSPLQKGHNYMQFWINKHHLVRELRETGVFCRMFKFNIDTSLAADDELAALNIEKDTVALMRQVDTDNLKVEALSASFSRFVPGKPYKIKVPIQYLNATNCAGVKSGGVVLYLKHYLECEFVGDALPQYSDYSIKVDLKDLELGKQIRIQDLIFGNGFTQTKIGPTQSIVTCKKISVDVVSTPVADTKAAATPAPAAKK